MIRMIIVLCLPGIALIILLAWIVNIKIYQKSFLIEPGRWINDIICFIFPPERIGNMDFGMIKGYLSMYLEALLIVFGVYCLIDLTVRFLLRKLHKDKVKE